MVLQDHYVNSREHVRVASGVIEENKTLLWLVSTVSTALAGWAVYTMRKLHYSKIEHTIEGTMSSLNEKIEEKIERWEKMKNQDKAEKDKEVPRTTNLGALHTLLVVAPAASSAFLLGYMIGRTQGSYYWHRQLQVKSGLNKDRVYVAVVPQRLFDAKTVARELEQAVVKRETPTKSRGFWYSRRWGQEEFDTQASSASASSSKASS